MPNSIYQMQHTQVNAFILLNNNEIYIYPAKSNQDRSLQIYAEKQGDDCRLRGKLQPLERQVLVRFGRVGARSRGR